VTPIPARSTLVLAILAVLLCAGRGEAQQRGALLQPAVRADAFFARIVAFQAGVGVSVPAGTNVRVSLVGAMGGSTEDGRRGVSARVDGVARFLLDPTFATHWVPYAGGGVSLRYDRAPRWRGVLVVLLGLEGPRRGGVVPFVEAGWGGGVRVGFGFRRALRGRR
jgi:hypothetical protein